MNRKFIDWPTFIAAFILLLAVVIPLVIYPEAGTEFVNKLNDFVSGNFGFLYLVMGLGIFFFLIFVAFSQNGHVKLGEKGEKPEFGTASWAGMLFSAGIGSSILYWATIEWAFYYQGPPFGIDPNEQQLEAIQWASTYGIFHWGPIAWAIYTLPAIPMAYFFYVRKTPVIKISETLRPLLGKNSDTVLGRIIDVLFIFGLLGGAGTTLALGTPLITTGVTDIFPLEDTMLLRTIILLSVTAIFGISSYLGLKEGIKRLSDFNLILAVFLLIFVFVTGPTLFIAETTTNSIGLILDNFFHMSTWTEPLANIEGFNETGFPESWTVFYWAWWLVYAPFVGLFIARISRGRTIRQVIVGTIIYGSLGCILFFGIMGNFGLYLQLTGSFDVVSVLNEQGAPVAIISIINQLPLARFMVIVFVILSIVFLATTFDSSSYILASVTQKEVENGEPERWNRLFWAFTLCILPLTLMFLGGLSTLQTASIVGGFPLIFIMFLLAWSFMRASTGDLKADDKFRPKTVVLDYKSIREKIRLRRLRKKEKKNPKNNDEE
ncbi:BCCT family transporter [Tenuibacillus multivorans]|uniref:Betaine/carnitine transporter, BCCT family n=1 Tax=Tenuibacillus multivorans TaxID=237069 RepID=A0A1G9YEK8_9BACI|nr:BCCT family transporter [Tenuibacillus multivorans]GEL78549.1 transporter [Tenuibacillus multivorans]SDN07470.1 betaine/carnitine transporter, BCCT family [Tenuibacillus multivorans]